DQTCIGDPAGEVCYRNRSAGPRLAADEDSVANRRDGAAVADSPGEYFDRYRRVGHRAGGGEAAGQDGWRAAPRDDPAGVGDAASQCPQHNRSAGAWGYAAEEDGVATASGDRAVVPDTTGENLKGNRLAAVGEPSGENAGPRRRDPAAVADR